MSESQNKSSKRTPNNSPNSQQSKRSIGKRLLPRYPQNSRQKINKQDAASKAESPSTNDSKTVASDDNLLSPSYYSKAKILKTPYTNPIPRITAAVPRLSTDKLKTTYVKTAGGLIPVGRSPEEKLGQLFAEVQKRRVYDDGKTFVDLIPRKRTRAILEEYELAKNDAYFDLRDFVTRHFYQYKPSGDKEVYETQPGTKPDDHLRNLWSVLERRNRKDRGSLFALPHKYIVPGGRFSEQFYWDTYFIMLGLAAHGEWNMIEGMMKNYAFMIRKFGFIPTANRTYFLSRSQPPFFSQMVLLLAQHKGRSVIIEYLPLMVREYKFWMRGQSKLQARKFKSERRLVEMPDGSFLNRYYDDKSTPRPESHDEDVTTALETPDRQPDRMYLHLRAAAESGWDFSSRWFLDPQDIRTIHTADIIPVDLNCLLYLLESTIAEAYSIIRQPLLKKRFLKLAARRVEAINTYCWHEDKQFYGDYNFHEKEPTQAVTLAGVFPLYARIATAEQANAVAKRIADDFLKDGGLITTLVDNGQQWDSPNGWAPLHWIVIEGLRNYGHHELASEIKQRWIKTNLNLYETKGKMVEKYNVTGAGEGGGGGEYPLQDGFGWTNGVLAMLLHESEADTPA